MTFQQLLTRPLIYLDGGTGTMLQARGLKPGEIMGNEHKGMLFGAELNNLMLKGIFQDE